MNYDNLKIALSTIGKRTNIVDVESINDTFNEFQKEFKNICNEQAKGFAEEFELRDLELGTFTVNLVASVLSDTPLSVQDALNRKFLLHATMEEPEVLGTISAIILTAFLYGRGFGIESIKE